MLQQEVREQLYQKYIAPTKKKRESFIGIEIEMPIVNLDKKAVSFDIVQEITEKFLEAFSFEITGRDDDGRIYAAQDKKTGDILSYDCSYNNLELSMGREKELHTLNKRFVEYYLYLQKLLKQHHYTLTGMGINPYREYNHNVPIANERYRMLFHHLETYPKYFNEVMFFHRYPKYGTFCSAAQVQLDVNEEDLIKNIDAFTKIEPIKALLFSNSILLNDREDLLCCRDMLWENSTHGVNPHNIGMFDSVPETIDELQAYIESESLYCVMRDGKYVNFAPICIMDYFKQDKVRGEFYQDGEYHPIDIVPEIGDIEYLRTFKFEDLTFRGTIEYRSVCCQPVADAMSMPAFHVGLKENLDRLSERLEEDYVLYHHGYTATELRRLFVKRDLPSFIDEDVLYELARDIVDIAKEGLVKRGFGEEIFLDPLYKRIEERKNPAEKMLEALENGISLEEMIEAYGKIK